MLVELHIDNFAIIESVSLTLNPGLIIFTGETGAGKSILIDAVDALLGGKADSNMIRSEAKNAYIEGVFKLNPSLLGSLINILSEDDIIENQEFLTLSREIRLGGRSITRINGHPVNLSVLKQVSQMLVDIHGQSEHLSLLRPSQHLTLLDNFANTKDLLEKYQPIYHRHQYFMRELEELHIEERESARRSDMLRFQINEIESANLRDNEEDALLAERNRLANAENITLAIQQARVALEESDPDTISAIDLLGQAVTALHNLSRLDSTQNNLAEQAQMLFDEAIDLSNLLRKYQDSIEYNPSRLDLIESRLSQIQLLKKKYGDSIQAIQEFSHNASQQLDRITNASEKIQELEDERESLLYQMKVIGQELSLQRHHDAEKLAKMIEAELNDLNMSKTKFQVSFMQRQDPQGILLENGERVSFNINGLDVVEFLIAPNPGEGLKPLVKIASGGETSRLMLAMKHVLVTADNVPSLIFDEIDQGIGGRVGTVVGEKLWKLSRQHQVLCVTHLPQIAAFADMHFHVYKEFNERRTLTQVELLNDGQRKEELAQMMGGISEGTLQSSNELLEFVVNVKNKNNQMI